ncbi:MOSC domain-containing protein [Nocardioides mangrovi]|uniref:MOSC domain-containing protein n=1 Tax=Nocardioides mangrovi TaxID=2874580 RepID=A0ABS7UKM9_9ACTN|nr:MOSC domain-containing protein [Nocardioides mangrovi]MBZ5741147.1 MOSC domain-containing protein [Nocardioides mangrovi]
MPSPAEPAGRVRSVNLGSREPNPAKRVGVTGHHKRPVESALLRAPGPKHGGLGSGLVGDFIGDTRSHGGDGQAVYAFAREELDRWSARLDRPLADGAFGENLTTEGLDVDAARVGDRWAVGDEVVLEVTGPRLPCATFALRMGEPGWLRTFSEVGRTGAYLAIVTGGTVRPGDAVRVLSTADHGIDLPTTFRALLGDLDAADLVLAAGILPADEEEWLRDRLDRRT